ncbi:zinc finger protein 425-like [Procambarus clarkii]|uniref:zinc finger protein 425-like n=1 Tax=Procambarus clarkii TaxID=6728 RepID=UPI0037426D81
MKTHQCPQCPKVFTCPGSVKRHMLVHSGDKPHECPECGKKFSRLGSMKRHMMVHAAERPFQCAECDKKIRERGNIIKHMLVHSGDAPNIKKMKTRQCPQCLKDLKKIMHYGFKNDDKTLPVKLKGVICDAPAKAMVKAIKLHSGYFGCDRCTQEGVWNGRMTYQQVKNLQLRTDEDFRNQSNSQHHHGRSPFCDLNINMEFIHEGDSSKKTKPHRYDDRDRKRKYFSVNTT